MGFSMAMLNNQMVYSWTRLCSIQGFPDGDDCLDDRPMDRNW